MNAQHLFDKIRVVMTLSSIAIVSCGLIYRLVRNRSGTRGLLGEVSSAVLVVLGVIWLNYGGFGVADRLLYPGQQLARGSREETVLVIISLVGMCTCVFFAWVSRRLLLPDKGA